MNSNSITNAPYPRLVVDLKKLRHNIDVVLDNCSQANISVCGAIKGFNGLPKAVEEFAEAGFSQLGTSRMRTIKELTMLGIQAKYLLLRVPMLSEADDVVKYANVSLNSDIQVIRALNDAAAKAGTSHEVILMSDLGDLREGFWDQEELLDCAEVVEKELDNIVLKGVGTNLGCYGSIKPTVTKMNELISIAELVEKRIGRRLEIISGGATSSYVLVLNQSMPERINHLRIGEGILNNYDLPEIWGLDIENMYQDVFTFEAEVIEVRDKPSHPVGEICIDSFGRKPEYTDRGIRRRALLAAGKLDFALNDKIFPQMEGATVIGSSSDHMILDIEDSKEEVKVGDIVTFHVSYPSMMYLSNDKYVNVIYNL
ncbi:alanine/ornithine racemase family PLP-dependent enzyme [Anaerovorax odorimutans]|uniref:Alanine/ornithine racemase family PLP-dependent enzyme n=1 Tax=Anaerovorax odorimutans TaxID=109327 RepID=A0ABT1RPB7_9FIRM|nr:alanine/ornithine racemase family PLP-dependent enzyme [Anaerovorax odorimutans]MCQ4636731.1 alanine/ornithine racemase family PLP-dependent enzyme [Anaerovorax odorimutans]